MRPARQPTTPVLLDGTIANPDPASLTILLDWFDSDLPGHREEHDAVLTPRGHLLPARGDACKAIRTETGDWCVVWWDGAIPDPPAGRYVPDWQTPALTSGWTDWAAADPTFRPVASAVSPSGLVTLSGIVSRAASTWTTPHVMFTLPAGSRPRARCMFGTVGFANGVRGVCRIDIYSNGNVELFAPPGTWGGSTNLIGLDGISFWAEA